MEENKELIRFASRPALLILMVIASGIFIFYELYGVAIVDTLLWFTLSAVCEWTLEKPLSSIVTNIKTALKRFKK
jgi:hypothetical protein